MEGFFFPGGGGGGGGGTAVLRLIADKVLLPCAAIAVGTLDAVLEYHEYRQRKMTQDLGKKAYR